MVTPSQSSSGGKSKLGRITKVGDSYLRTLLVQGARSVMIGAEKKTDLFSRWVSTLSRIYPFREQALVTSVWPFNTQTVTP